MESEANSPFQLCLAPAPVPDPDIVSSDLPYFNFFLDQMSNVLPYVNIFQSAPANLFSTSLHHPALRHSILAISALIADKKREMGRRRALEHIQTSLKLLQDSLTIVKVDEGIVMSIFLLAYFSVTCGEHVTARKHLAGLHLVLTQLQEEHKSKNRGLLSPYAISPLTMLVWRMAFRMDFIGSMMYGSRPVFPMYVLI
jgi:Fungal specific transcription factor domain